MAVDWQSFVSLDYWLEGFIGNSAALYTPAIGVHSWSFWAYLWIFVACIAIGVGATLYAIWGDKRNPILKHLPFVSNNFIAIGFLGFGLFLSRMLNFRFLSSRLLMLALAIYGLVIIILIIRYCVVYLPVEWKYYQKLKQQDR